MNRDLTENITANVTKETASALSELVRKSGISRSKYVSILIEEAVKKQRVFKLKTSVVVSEI